MLFTKKYGKQKWVVNGTVEEQEEGFKQMCLALVRKGKEADCHKSGGGYTVVSVGIVSLFCFMVQTRSAWAAREVKSFFKVKKNKNKTLIVLVTGRVGRFTGKYRESHVGVLGIRTTGTEFRFSYFDPNLFEPEYDDLEDKVVMVSNVAKDIVRLLCKRNTPHVVPIFTGENDHKDCFRDAVLYLFKVLDRKADMFSGKSDIIWFGGLKKYALASVEIKEAYLFG